MRLALEDTIHLYSHFCVLTYPSDFPLDGKTVKRNLHALIQLLRRQDIKDYFWGIEFQKRGAPHINILLPCAIDGDRLRKAWFKIVGSGDENHLTYGASIEEIRDKSKLSTYIVGYQYKKEQKDVPEAFKNVGRFWGTTKRAKLAGSHTRYFESNEALDSYIKPVNEFYDNKLKEWSSNTGKDYKRLSESFTLWGEADRVNEFIIRGVVDDDESYVLLNVGCED
jgi:hypothetical protein